ncbi:MAG: AMP-binding protein [Gemmatimonadota bacterium]
MDAIPDVDGLTIGTVLRRQARRFPDHEALVFPQHAVRLTYGEYDWEVDRVARALLALDVRPGDHVAVWATNWPHWPLLFLGAARIGAVLVTVNPAYRTHELSYALRQPDTQVLFLIDRFKTSDYFAMMAEVCPETRRDHLGQLHCSELPELRWIVALTEDPAPGMLAWSDFLAMGDDVSPVVLAEVEEELDPMDAVNLQYTSGTTGFPKGVLLSHRSLLLNAWFVGAGQGLDADDRVCVPVPFYHCFGTVIGILCCLVHGATMLVPAEYFDAEAVLDCVEVERATALYGVPTMFVAELEHETFPGRDLSSLRTGIMAGSPCPIEVMNRVVNDMGAREMTIAYGLTEASPAITQTLTTDPVEVRVSTVGRPLPGVEVRIVDPENGEVLGGEMQGELQSRGHNTMLGYYNMPEATAEAILEGGWLRTGDLAVRGADGYYRITGRIKDMIIRGGENIYPREIEEFLYTHPAVETAQVFGVPDPRFGEEICAWIRLKRGARMNEEDMRIFCREHLAHFKVPRYVKFVEDYPLTVTGKIQKFRMREAAVRELGLEEVSGSPTSTEEPRGEVAGAPS